MSNINTRYSAQTISTATHVPAGRPVVRSNSALPKSAIRKTQPQTVRTEVREEPGILSRAFIKLHEGSQAIWETLFSEQRAAPKRQFIPGPTRDLASPAMLRLINSGSNHKDAQARQALVSRDAQAIASLDNVIRTNDLRSLIDRPNVTSRPTRPVNPRA